MRGFDIPRRLLAVAGLALVAACGSDAVAPTAAPTAGPKHDVILESMEETSDSMVAVITITPTGGFFNLGKNGVYFPANVICDPATSSYGPTEWDKPCTPLKTPITLTARMGKGVDVKGWIQFDRDLRFVPSTDASKWVYLYIYSRELATPRPKSKVDLAKLEEKYTIFWRPDPLAELVNEGLTDPTLRTHILWRDGYAYRRVKHFSGFQVGVGFAEETLLGVSVGY